MGGTNEMIISGLRFHVNNQCVHIHDDKSSTKFESTQNIFKKDLQNAFKDLAHEGDGVVMLNGNTDVNLCVGKRDKKYFIFLEGGQCIKDSLEKFAKTL
jgi:hypothetical protein